MLTILLWILLILAAAALVIIASPIRFGAAGTFGTSRRASGNFWVSYIHPALFAYEYSSTGRKERSAIFGINPKWFKWKKRKRKSVDSPDSISDVNAHAEDDGDNLMTRILRRVENINDEPIYTKTAGVLNDIKSDRSYRYLRDRALRKKIFKWLRRVWKCAVTTVRFDRLELRATAGFEDPAQTGKMYGYFIAAKDALSLRNKTVNMELKPIFTEERLEAEIEFACRTSIAIITSHALTLALTFPYRLIRKPKNHHKGSN